MKGGLRCLKTLRAAVFLAVGFSVAMGVLAQHPPATLAPSGLSPGRADAVRDQTVAQETRLREGNAISDALGEFHDTGDRIIFQPGDRKTPLMVLENLALERISLVLEENPSPRLWSVTGTVTEYRGANYLLVTRAVLKAHRTNRMP